MSSPTPCTTCGSRRTFPSGGHKYGCAAWAKQTGMSRYPFGNDGHGNTDPDWGGPSHLNPDIFPTTDAEWADMCNPNEGSK